jgi:hypothetical protein
MRGRCLRVALADHAVARWMLVVLKLGREDGGRWSRMPKQAAVVHPA